MRFTKYGQSCAIVEGAAGGRALIDPGNVALDATAFDDFGTVDAVLFTHRHADHLDPRAVDAARERGLPIYGNADVAEVIGEGVTTIAGGQRFEAAGFDVVAHDMPHVVMVNGAPGPPNTGFVFDGRLLHPGDSLQVDGMRIDLLAVPIAGPSISFHDAYTAVQTTGAKRVLPMHHDTFIADPRFFARWCDLAEVVVLDRGETADL